MTSKSQTFMLPYPQFFIISSTTDSREIQKSVRRWYIFLRFRKFESKTEIPKPHINVFLLHFPTFGRIQFPSIKHTLKSCDIHFPPDSSVTNEPPNRSKHLFSRHRSLYGNKPSWSQKNSSLSKYEGKFN